MRKANIAAEVTKHPFPFYLAAMALYLAIVTVSNPAFAWLERGRQALQRCLRLTPPPGDGMPTLACVHYRLANILEQMGDRAGAAVEYAAAVREHPDFRPTKIVLKN